MLDIKFFLFLTYSELNHKAYWHLKTEKLRGFFKNLVGQTGRHEDANKQINKVQTGEMTAHITDTGECRRG